MLSRRVLLDLDKTFQKPFSLNIKSCQLGTELLVKTGASTGQT